MLSFAVLILTVAILLVCVSGQRAAPDEAGPDALFVNDCTPIGEAFELGLMARDVMMAPDGKSVMLYDLGFVEDDGPGAARAGGQWQTPQETFCGDVKIKKILRLNRPQAKSVRLLLCAGPLEGEAAPVEIEINGNRMAHKATDPGGFRRDWQVVEIPPKVIKAGDNEVILSCAGELGWWISLAPREIILRNAPERRFIPNRTFKSTDGGGTWTEWLGPGGELIGEAMVRLNAEQYAAEGHLVGPVIDLALLACGQAAIPPAMEVRWVKIAADADIPQGASIELSIRTGTTPLYSSVSWGPWVPCGKGGRLVGALKRFLIWRATLRTSEPVVTPTLKGLEVQAELGPKELDWADRVKGIHGHNEMIRHTSIPFQYEKFDEPQLVKLRRKYRLDEVVAGADTEMERMIKLRNWVAGQWTWTPPEPPYPAWDAHEILERDDGMCVQFAIAYMQCALSLGIQTRFVFGDFPHTSLAGKTVAGHEVNEFWSNEYGKWVFMDANRDECFVEHRTGVPASMLELHEDLMSIYCPDGPMRYDGTNVDAEHKSQAVKVWRRDEPTPQDEPPIMRLKWGCVRYMPRNNFYAHRYPEPVTQGLSIWAYTGYRQWQDDKAPRQWQYPHYTARRSDIDWTLNQVRWSAELGEGPGAIEIRMGTVTPDFDTYLIRVDGSEWLESGPAMTWQLKTGYNRLDMRTRNRAGVLGRISWLCVQYDAGESP